MHRETVQLTPAAVTKLARELCDAELPEPAVRRAPVDIVAELFAAAAIDCERYADQDPAPVSCHGRGRAERLQLVLGPRVRGATTRAFCHSVRSVVRRRSKRRTRVHPTRGRSVRARGGLQRPHHFRVRAVPLLSRYDFVWTFS